MTLDHHPPPFKNKMAPNFTRLNPKRGPGLTPTSLSRLPKQHKMAPNSFPPLKNQNGAQIWWGSLTKVWSPSLNRGLSILLVHSFQNILCVKNLSCQHRPYQMISTHQNYQYRQFSAHIMCEICFVPVQVFPDQDG